MIDHISIRDFAIIDNVDVDFHEGLSIITGETGSGKSILITAISLALGSRADSSYVRNGRERAIVELTATLPKKIYTVGDAESEDCVNEGDAKSRVSNGELEEIVIYREVNASGKNLCKLNGETVTLAQLAAKCREIADIHGQYDNQSLLDPETHIDLVDGYHAKIIGSIKDEYSNKYRTFLESRKRLSDLLTLESENDRKQDFYKFELKEIESVNPLVGEDGDLSERLSLLQNSEKIFASAKDAYESINGGGSSSNLGRFGAGAYEALGNTVSSLEEISEYSDEINSLLEETRDIYYRLEDVSRGMSDIMDKLVFDPGEIDSIIERLNALDSLKKKYSAAGRKQSKDEIDDLEAVLKYRDKIKKELAQIENFDVEKERLKKEYDEARLKLLEVGKKLSEARKKSAIELKTKILAELKDLNFSEANLEIQLIPNVKTNEQKETEPANVKTNDKKETGREEAKNNNASGGTRIIPGENGLEKAEILITTNVGEPLKPLVKTSSGGEISRIMLAIKNITADYDGVPTLIFDEIDQGISGKTAAVVGRKLCEISKNHQVICITHLPQIAAKSDQSYRIYKESDESKTYTHIEKLDSESKVTEIARLLGGEEITETAIRNARELIGV